MADAQVIDIYDNRATVALGGEEFPIIASKLAERIYGKRFRHNVDDLGDSISYRTVSAQKVGDDGLPVFTTDTDGKKVPVMESRTIELAYTGRLKLDVMVSANVNVGPTGEIPQEQVIAAVWAMARAAGSTDKTYDEFFAWYLTLPSNAEDDIRLWEVVCVDLAERAFFRHGTGPHDADQPNEG